MRNSGALRCSAACAAATLAFLCTAAAYAQNYPNKPIRWIVAFSPGGGGDTLVRTVARKLSDALGQEVVVDNRPGAGGNIGYTIVARAAPDGYTLLHGYIGNLAIAPNLYARLPYDPVNDFAPISEIATAPNIFVSHPSVPANNLGEFIAYAKANPKKVNFASPGIASAGHLAGELLKTAAGIDMVHVPYKGAGQAVIDLLGGQVQVMFSSMTAVIPHLSSGKLKAFATTGLRRSPTFPDLPTVAESGYPGFEATSWHGVLAPAGTPKPIIDLLHNEIIKVLESSDVKERLNNLGMEIIGSSPQAFREYIKRESQTWGKVVKASGMKPN